MQGTEPPSLGSRTGRSTLSLALGGICPNCGQGKLYKGILAVNPRCPSCHFDLSAIDSGDGAAAFVILFLGAVLVPLVFWVDFRFQPPLWVHFLLWLPLTLGGAILLLRPIKAWLIIQQFRHRAGEKHL